MSVAGGQSLRQRLHCWPYFADGLIILDRAVEEFAQWLRDEADDIEAHHSGEPGDGHVPIVTHLRYLAEQAEEP